MDFDVLERSPEVAPLLVRLYDAHNLYSSGVGRKSDTAGVELADVMLDLLRMPIKPTEKELITDVLFGLVKRAEKDFRKILSERIASLDNMPLRMVLGLANDEITIADPVLRSSPILADVDLIYIVKAKGVEHARVIAHREGIGPQLINVLAGTHDFEVAVNLSKNDGVRLTDMAINIFERMAQTSDILAEALVLREDVPASVTARLYHFVSEELKETLVRSFGEKGMNAAHIADEIVREIVTPPRISEKTYYDLLAMAKNLRDRGELRLHTIVTSLRRGQYAMALVQFAVWCDLPVEVARAILKQPSGKSLAIVCKAMEVTKAEFMSLYLLTERTRKEEGNRVVTHQELTHLMLMFDSVDKEKARELVEKSRAS